MEDKAAQIAGKVADAAARTAQTLEAVAARASAAAASADSAFKSLAAAYAKQEAHKLAKIAKATVRALKKAGHAVARAAKAVAKAAYKYSGAEDVVGCVTHPSLAGCAKAALTVALTVGTAGEGEIAEIGLNAAEHAGEDIAEEGVGNAVKDAAESCVVGGKSFSAGTKVLLASGKAVPIASLKPGEKVLATNTRTGKTRPETISVVMVHHDTNLYDLKIKAGSRTAVIDTTSNHPFWDATSHQWTNAVRLHPGDRLRTPQGGYASVVDGWVPQQSIGWMWDLTVPGDHDFYVVTAAAPILVHNCDVPGMPTLHEHFPTQEAARDAALRDAGITDPELSETDMYEGGRQMLGPRSEPWKKIEGFDHDGNVREIQLHHGHSFEDGTSFGPHYKNPVTGFHSFWDAG